MWASGAKCASLPTRRTSYWRSRPGHPIIAAVILTIISAALLVCLQWQVHSTLRFVIATAVSSSEEAIVKQVDAVRRDLVKQSQGCSSALVHDAYINHRAQLGSACQGLDPKNLQLNVTANLVAPVVVVSHDRAGYLGKTLVTLLKYWTDNPINTERFPLFVSIDGTHQPTIMLAASLRFSGNIQVIQNVQDYKACSDPEDGYCWLSHHYKMLLQLFFKCLNAPRLIFLEDDLAVAPDFFSYFAATAPLLDEDKSLLCISAWNDHGQAGRALNNGALYRTDVMPGLGWMLTAAVGLEFLPLWPSAGWDEVLRDQRHIKGRQCVFPEVARTFTFGELGASKGIGFKEHLAKIALNTRAVDWGSKDLSYLEEQRYSQVMASWLAAANRLDTSVLQQLGEICDVKKPSDGNPQARDLLITYTDNAHFSKLALTLPPMMWDISHGGKVPRASYNGTVIVRCRGRRLFIVREQVVKDLQQRTSVTASRAFEAAEEQ